MLTGSQNNVERILNLKTENSALPRPTKKSKTQETKYQCVVCQMNKTSLSELHWHQTYQHSTEELSLSVIGWKGLVKIVGPPPSLSSSQEKENQSTQKSIYNSFSKKPSQFYYLSSSILRVKDNPKGDLEAPIDCSLPPLVKVENNEDERNRLDDQKRRSLQFYNFQYNTGILNVGQSSRDIRYEGNILNTETPIDCSIPSIKLENKQEIPNQLNQSKEQVAVIEMRVKEEKNDSDRWKNEWNCVKDISMEDFERGADNLCQELKDYKRLCALRKATKRKNTS